MSTVKPSVPRAGTRGTILSVAAVAIAALVPPLLFSDYGLDVLSEIVVYAIVAISLDFILGYGGLVSFGHAAFFGLGAYGTLLVSVDFNLSPWIGLLAGVGLSVVAATLIGAFCVRTSGVSFFMLTLAFAQLFYSGAVKWRGLTGGSDGMGGLNRPEIFGYDSNNSPVMYLMALGFLVLVVLVTSVIIRSQFGHALVGLRENNTRMVALGYAAKPIKLVAFIISGAIAGLGGGLYAFYNGFVSPDVLSWATSGTLLLMVVLGGKGTLIGPIVGAAVFLLMKDFVSSQTDHWLLIVGGIFVGCVMFFPDGIYGLRRLLVRKPPARAP